MKIIRYLTAAILFLLSSTALVQAQETQTQWKALNEDAMTLYRQGQYVQAVVVAKQALETAKANVGPDHPDVACQSQLVKCNTSRPFSYSVDFYLG